MLSARRTLAAVIIAFACSTGTAIAKEPGVKILAPADAAKLASEAENVLSYEVMKGHKGDHVHVYVDGKEVGTLHKRKGDYTLKELAAGERQLCVKVVNKGHTPIGMERCIKVTVE